MDNKILLLILLFFILFLLYFYREGFTNNQIKKNGKLNILLSNKNDDKNMFDLTIVRVRVHKLDYNWLEPFNKKSSYESIGTGFFINLDGYLLTNFHVVDKGIKVFIQIPMNGSKTYDCDIISVYPRLDIALLKVIDYKTDKYLELGDSDKLSKGELSIAIGYPLGQNKIKLTSGVVSGIQDGDIQTDSPINNGNSGGPLINANNKVIGINYAGNNEAQNIGYAIPINYVKSILDTMFKSKLINHPILGTVFNNTNDIILNLSGLCKEGYYVADVLKNGTFDKGGIKNGDIICSFDKKKIDNYGEIMIDSLNTKFHITNYLKYKKVGDEIEIVLIRDIKNNNFQNKNDIKLITTKIKLQPNTFYKIRNMHYQYEKIDYQIIGGLVIMNLYNNHLKELDEDDKLKKIEKYTIMKNKVEPKLIITHILKGSKISEDNIFKTPQILSKVNNIEVNTVDNLRIALKQNLEQKEIKYFSFLTEEKKYLVLGFDETKKEELFLSKKYDYQLTDFTKNLLNIKK